jgi:hypothetical protein
MQLKDEDLKSFGLVYGEIQRFRMQIETLREAARKAEARKPTTTPFGAEISHPSRSYFCIS